MIELEPFTSNDFDRLIGWVKDEAFLYQFAGPVFHFPLDHKQLEKYIEEKNRKIFRVKYTEHNKIIGHAELNDINQIHKKARISRILIGDETYRGKGLGKQLIQKILITAFLELDLHRVDLGVFDFNKGAIACYESCGLKKEGLLRETFKFQDKFWSVYNMSILKHEWESLSKSQPD